MRNTTLYDTDFYTWCLETAAQIRQGEREHLDWAHLAEEIEDLGNAQRHAMTSHFKQLLWHLLKWRYHPARRGASWRDTIAHARESIADLLEDYPGLDSRQEDSFGKAYPRARRGAAREMRVDVRTLPEACPWTLAQVLEPDFYPEDPASR